MTLYLFCVYVLGLGPTGMLMLIALGVMLYGLIGGLIRTIKGDEYLDHSHLD